MAAKTILGLENPLLDISVNVSNEFLEKHNKVPGQQTLADEKDRPLFEEIVTLPDVKYIAGGSCQNTIRGAQWISQTPGITHFIGCIGNDENGKKLTEIATADGVQVHYYTSQKFRTGTCAVLIRDKERCLCADLAAANDYQHSHFQSNEIQELVHKKVEVAVTTGYFLTVSPDTIIELGKHCAANNKLFIFAIAAPFVVQFYWEKLKEVITYADLVICNHEEAAAFMEKAGQKHETLAQSAKIVSEMPKVNDKRKRTVIFTQGSKPTITYHESEHGEWPIIQMAKEEIVDVNGAGDAFLGGLVAGLALNKPFSECIRAAAYTAAQILRVSGTQYPAKCEFKWN